MHSSPTGKAGRPRGSSRDMLQEAASELFLEQTYAGTTIEQIARRAGVSRNTFFNYFPAKSDLLWVDVDEGLAQLPAALDAAAVQTDVMEAVRLAMLDLACGFGPAQVPWALTQAELMHTTGELEASALSRFARAAGMLTAFVARRTGRNASDLLCRSFAMAVLAATAAAAIDWARAGVQRGTLVPYVDTAVSPVCNGYRASFSFG
jgi:AcrR family transcriptional regulator